MNKKYHTVKYNSGRGIVICSEDIYNIKENLFIFKLAFYVCAGVGGSF
jgi:hypothetical protein